MKSALLSVFTRLIYWSCHQLGDVASILEPVGDVRRLQDGSTGKPPNGRSRFYAWISNERRVCPIVQKLGASQGEESIIRKCREQASGHTVTTLQDAPLDGTKRLPKKVIPGTEVGSVFGSLLADGAKGGDAFGQVKLRLDGTLQENEYEISLRWRTEINRHLDEYLVGTEKHSSMAFAFAHLLEQEIVLSAESPETVETSVCNDCTHSPPTCSRIPILWEDGRDSRQCYIRSPVEKCVAQPTQADVNLPHGGQPQMKAFNKVTGWIDASSIYGTTDAVLDVIGFQKSGFLKEDFDDLGNPFLSFSPKLEMCYHSGFCRCLGSGDARVSTHSGSSLMHTLFVRLHNFVLDMVKDISLTPIEKFGRGGISGRRVRRQPFARVREFVIYSLQKIAYEEFLPALLGPSMAKLVNSGALKTLRDEGLVKEFHTAFFRLHQLIPERDWVVNDHHQIVSETEPHEAIFNPLFTLVHGSRGIARGLMWRPHALRKSFFAHVTDKLSGSAEGVPFDIVSVTILRGREAGLLPYSAYYKHAQEILQLADLNGPLRPSSFVVPQTGEETSSPEKRQSSRERPFPGAARLDAFPGAISELPVQIGALVGGTQAAVLARVFHSLAWNDPFFYTKRKNYRFENGLKRVNLQLLICLLLITSGNIDEVVVANPFYLPGQDNPEGSCVDLLRNFQLSLAIDRNSTLDDLPIDLSIPQAVFPASSGGHFDKGTSVHPEAEAWFNSKLSERPDTFQKLLKPMRALPMSERVLAQPKNRGPLGYGG